MENRQDCLSPWDANFVEPTTKCKPTWPSMGGAVKRKASQSPDFGPYECFEPPLKQFAFDNSPGVVSSVPKDNLTINNNIDGLVANNDLQNGSGNNQGIIQTQTTEDVEMEENYGDTKTTVTTSTNIDNNKKKEEEDDDIEDDDTEGNLLYTKNFNTARTTGKEFQQQGQPFGSVVLSEEVLASMGRGRRGDEASAILPQSIIMNHMYKNNMALVLWKPSQDLHTIAKSLNKIPPQVILQNPNDQDDQNEETIVASSAMVEEDDDTPIYDSGGMDI